MRRRTLRAGAEVSGRGLHTGAACRVVARPAPWGSGIRLFRRDLGEEIPVRPEAVSETRRGTTLRNGSGARVCTVEHFLSAAAGLGLTDLEVDVDAEEFPILDGSALGFLDALEAAGVVEGEEVEPLRLGEVLEVRDGDRWIRAEPAERLELDVEISFPAPGLERQRVCFCLSPGRFREELAGARTFCLEEEVEVLRRAGLIRGGGLDCALVVGREGVRNGPLHWPDEFARHKALDLLGDLALLPAPLHARVTAHKAGHRLHVELARKIHETHRRLGLEVLRRNGWRGNLDFKALRREGEKKGS